MARSRPRSRSRALSWPASATIAFAAVGLFGLSQTVTATASTLPSPSGYSTLVFEDSFSGTSLDQSKWNTYMTSRAASGHAWHADGQGGSSDGYQYEAAYFESGNLAVNNGLTIDASRRSSHSGYPWTSGVVDTYNKFQFDGGYVQVKAKVPAGAGMWPAIWLLPGPGGTAGDDAEIDMFEGNFLGNGVSAGRNFAWHLITSSGKDGGVSDAGVALSAASHVYGMAWVPGQSITWYLDGQPIGQLTRAQGPVPNEPMELIVSLGVARRGTGQWHAVSSATTPSPEALHVSEVQVWQ